MTKPVLFDVGENARTLFVRRAIRIRSKVSSDVVELFLACVISRYLIPVRSLLRKVRRGILALRDLFFG